MSKMICFDMDGTIADLYNVPNWLEKLRNDDPSPYRDARPMVDMEALREVLETLIEQGWEIRVITWLAKASSEAYKTAVRRAKLEWLKSYGFPYKKAHMVAYGTTKADCVRRVCDDAAILIDDSETVRNGWHLGTTIDPETTDIVEELRALIVK